MCWRYLLALFLGTRPNPYNQTDAQRMAKLLVDTGADGMNGDSMANIPQVQLCRGHSFPAHTKTVPAHLFRQILSVQKNENKHLFLVTLP